MDGNDELQLLREENTRLKSLLIRHGIAWEKDSVTTPTSPPAPIRTVGQLTTDEKITLFRSLFRGRSDIYPLRWQSAKGSTGYSPACGNEW